MARQFIYHIQGLSKVLCRGQEGLGQCAFVFFTRMQRSAYSAPMALGQIHAAQDHGGDRQGMNGVSRDEGDGRAFVLRDISNRRSYGSVSACASKPYRRHGEGVRREGHQHGPNRNYALMMDYTEERRQGGKAAGRHRRAEPVGSGSPGGAGHGRAALPTRRCVGGKALRW